MAGPARGAADRSVARTRESASAGVLGRNGNGKLKAARRA